MLPALGCVLEVPFSFWGTLRLRGLGLFRCPEFKSRTRVGALATCEALAWPLQFELGCVVAPCCEFVAWVQPLLTPWTCALLISRFLLSPAAFYLEVWPGEWAFDPFHFLLSWRGMQPGLGPAFAVGGSVGRCPLLPAIIQDPFVWSGCECAESYAGAGASLAVEALHSLASEPVGLWLAPWPAAWLDAFVRSFLVLQLLAFGRLLFFAIPLRGSAPRTNRTIRTFRGTLRGAPLAFALAFCVMGAAAMEADTLSARSSMTCGGGAPAAAGGLDAPPSLPGDVRPSRVVSVTDSHQAWQFPVMLLFFQRSPSFTTLEAGYATDTEDFVDLIAEKLLL